MLPPLKHLTFAGQDWEYLIKGSGKMGMLVFPGGGQYAQSQYKTAEAFSNKYKVIIPTIYGIYSIKDCCDGVNKILDDEKVDKVVVYGLSIGALLAQSYTKRNLGKVQALIISHGSTPTSLTYKRKIIQPLQLLNLALPVIPSALVKLIAKKWAGRIQGISRYVTQDFNERTAQDILTRKQLAKNFYQNYLNKKLVKTWISLHFDFYQDRFDKKTFKDWRGRVLILRTDNDPLMQDDGEFKKIYPKAVVKTFSGTGHLTDIYRQNEVIKSIGDFLLKW